MPAGPAREQIIEEHGGWSAAPASLMITKTAINNIARNVDDRQLSSRGRPKGIDFDKLEMLKKNKTWFR